MADDEWIAKVQRANDMLKALQAQRDLALNECVNLRADLEQANRTIEALQKTPAPAAPKTNGHALSDGDSACR